MSRIEGHMEDYYWWEVSPRSPAVSGLPLIQLPWLPLLCVCLCFPSSEPGVFPLSIFSAGTLDHPGIQSWTEVSGAVRHISGFALRSVSFWKFFQMGCAAFWGLTSISGGLVGQHLSLCHLHVLLCTPTLPTPSSQHPLCAPLFPVIPCFSPLTGLHCPSITVPCGLLSV